MARKVKHNSPKCQTIPFSGKAASQNSIVKYLLVWQPRCPSCVPAVMYCLAEEEDNLSDRTSCLSDWRSSDSQHGVFADARLLACSGFLDMLLCDWHDGWLSRAVHRRFVPTATSATRPCEFWHLDACFLSPGDLVQAQWTFSISVQGNLIWAYYSLSIYTVYIVSWHSELWWFSLPVLLATELWGCFWSTAITHLKVLSCWHLCFVSS